MRTVRLFVSSPGDVDDERKRVAFVAERLNGEYAGLARFETIRWETKFYTAHDTFQKQIPEAADCDIVIAIFWARLGSELPPDFPRMPDGQPYPSGTAYEVLSALRVGKDDRPEPQARHPDVYVFQKKAPPFPPPRDERDLTLLGTQWQQLKGFFERWFVSRDGHFLAAFQGFQTTDEFETQIEKLLRDWLAEHVLAARPVLWPIESKGSPFRGLEAFEGRHASVFFGRSRDVTRATDRLKAAAASGMPFLVLVGSSGAGKSSLARAGLVPRLTTPGVVPAVDAWRVAVMRPGGGGTPIEALAEALFARDEGDGISALPELVESDYPTAHDFALLMRAGAAATRPIERALDRVGEAQRLKGGFDRPLRTDLLLVVDQLDDLFASHVADEDRAQFAAVLAALLATKRVWVIATLRAALYERFLEEPALKALKDGGADYDLAPPGPAELADIVRKPAEAAALGFEHNAAGVGLDERLLDDAAGADTLPLLQFTLQRLFEERQTADGEVRLTFAAYEALGGLGGAIDQAAERALARLGEAEIGALPRLLRQLAVPVRDASSGGPVRAALTIRSAALADAAPNEAARRLVDALVEARILLSGQEGETASVRLAHQRVLDSWHRARDIVASNADFFRIREEIEEQRRRWEERGRKSELLLPAGLPLAEAETIVARHGDELDPQTRTFVAASSARARRRQRLTAAAAAVFAVVAVLASVLGVLAYRAQQRAETERLRAEANYTAAKTAVNRMVFDIAQGLRSVEGMRIETISRVLQTVRGSVDALAATNPSDPGLEWIRMAMLDEFANTYRQAGDRVQALAAASEAVSLLRALLVRTPDDARARRGLAIELERLGDIKRDAGDAAGARAAYEEAHAIYRDLIARAPEDTDLQQGMTVILDRLGGVKEVSGDMAAARAHYEESLAVRRRLAEREPNNTERRRFLAVGLNKIGNLYEAAGDRDKAGAAYNESLAIIRELLGREPDNTQWQSDLLIALINIGDLKESGDDRAGAQTTYEEALTIARRLAQRDPENVGWQRQIGLCLDRIGDVKRKNGDAAGARAAYDEVLAISRRLSERDPENVTWQRDVTVTLNKIGDLERARRDLPAAIAAYEESVAIRRRLLARNPDNVEASRDLQVALDRLADVKISALDFAAARAAFEERIALARSVLAKDETNTQWQKDLIFGLIKLTQVAEAAAGRDALEEARSRLEELDKAGRLDAATQRWLALVRDLLKDVPKGDKG
jgi:eukaryotic-like serine/threonine-protein kinase